MTRILLTPAALEDVPSGVDARVVAEPESLRFDAEGWLDLDRYWAEKR